MEREQKSSLVNHGGTVNAANYCPFCSSFSITMVNLKDGIHIGCYTPGCMGHYATSKTFTSEEEALKAWNTRR